MILEILSSLPCLVEEEESSLKLALVPKTISKAMKLDWVWDKQRDVITWLACLRGTAKASFVLK